jgi:hypothetical protein
MDKIILQGVSLEQFNELIQKGIKEQLEAVLNEFKPKPKKSLLTKQETLDLLSISVPTLDKRTKEGKLCSYKMDGRIYYKLDEVLSSLTPRKFK